MAEKKNKKKSDVGVVSDPAPVSKSLADVIEAPEEVLDVQNPIFPDNDGAGIQKQTAKRLPRSGGVPAVALGAGLLAAGGAGYDWLTSQDKKPEAGPEQPARQIVPPAPEPAQKQSAAPTTPEQQVSGKAASVAANVSGYVPGAAIGKASDRGVREAQRRFMSLADQLSGAGVDTSRMERDMADATARYEKRRTTSEWAEVAQTLAQAMGRYAAMYSGLDPDKIVVPTIDYGKRIDRDSGERDTAIRNAELRQRSLEKADERERTALRDRIGMAKEDLGTEENLMRSEQDRLNRLADLRLREQQEFGVSARDQRREEADRRREADSQYQAAKAIRQAAAQEADTLERTVNANLQTYMFGEDKKAKEKAAAALEGAGVDVQAIDLAVSETGKGWFTLEDPKKAQAQIEESLLKPIRDRIAVARSRAKQAEAIMDDRARILGLPGQEVQQAPAPQSQQPQLAPPAARVIRHKNGITRPYSEELWKQISSGPEAADFTLE